MHVRLVTSILLEMFTAPKNPDWEQSGEVSTELLEELSEVTETEKLKRL